MPSHFPTLCYRVVIHACVIAAATIHISRAAESGVEADAEAAARAMARDQESAGYTFRAEPWVGPLNKDVGKAVRVQLFKGNEYCICVAVPRKSGVHITGAVLDFEGKPVGDIQPVMDGWGFLLFFRPKKTGVYVVSMRETEDGMPGETACAVLTGYK